MWRNWNLTFRLDITFETLDGASKMVRQTRSLTFESTEAAATLISQQLGETQRADLSRLGAKPLAIHLLPLRLSRQLEDGSIEQRGWEYDRKLIWSAPLPMKRPS